jgi:hypothetical protein
MPVRIRRLKNGRYRVSTPKGIKAKSTSRKKAMKMKRLLNAIDHGWRPRKKRRRS